MMNCPNCGNEVEEEWKACPNCGNKLPSKEKKEETPVMMKVIMSFALALVLAFFFNSCSPSTPNKNSPSTPSVRQVLLTAGFAKGSIVIKNENNFDWTNAKIKVANGPMDQYDLSVGTIKAGETKQYQLSNFIDGNGKRYDAYKYVPKQVFVYADNASGGKQY